MDKYVLLDSTRNMYWKKNNYGYSEYLEEARVFTLEEAREKAYAQGVHDLEIIEYDKAEKVVYAKSLSHDDLKIYLEMLLGKNI